MKPPYPVLSTLELWQDHFARREGRWRIHYLEAQFLLGQCVWKWNAPEDKMLAVQKKLREIPHPVLNPEGICLDSAAGPGASGRDPIRPYMGVGAGLYGVQFAQSLYTLLWQCGRMDEIPDSPALLRKPTDDGDEGVCFGNLVEYIDMFYLSN